MTQSIYFSTGFLINSIQVILKIEFWVNSYLSSLSKSLLSTSIPPIFIETCSLLLTMSRQLSLLSSVYNNKFITSWSHHGQLCFMRLHFERYFSHNGRGISWNLSFISNTFISNTRLKLAKNNFLRLNFCCWKIICFLHPGYHQKIIGDILKNAQKQVCLF